MPTNGQAFDRHGAGGGACIGEHRRLAGSSAASGASTDQVLQNVGDLPGQLTNDCYLDRPVDDLQKLEDHLGPAGVAAQPVRQHADQRQRPLRRDKAHQLDPKTFEKVARKVLAAADPDGKLDESTAASKMEFTFDGRNTRTGLTPIKGQLDDHGVEVIRKALDALAAPQPRTGGLKDTRPPANRNAHALIAALRSYLDAGAGPLHGGERPHLSITLDWETSPAPSETPPTPPAEP